MNIKLIFTKLLDSGENVKLWRGYHFSGGQQTDCNVALKEAEFNNMKAAVSHVPISDHFLQ